MTTQEAIEQLKLTRAANKCNYADKYILDALDMAIRSLEAWKNLTKEIKDMSFEYQLVKRTDYVGFAVWKETAVSLDDVLDIIDKHLQEVENERTDDNSGL